MKRIKFLPIVALMSVSMQAASIKIIEPAPQVFNSRIERTCAIGFNGKYEKTLDCGRGVIKTDRLGEDWLKLTSVENDLNLYANPELENIENLSNLTRVGGSLYLDNNPLLTNLNGLKSLKHIGVMMNVCKNKSLTDISGLANLDYIGNAVYFENKTYTVKLPSDSYLCKNYASKIHFHDAHLANTQTRLQVCNP